MKSAESNAPDTNFGQVLVVVLLVVIVFVIILTFAETQKEFSFEKSEYAVFYPLIIQYSFYIATLIGIASIISILNKIHHKLSTARTVKNIAKEEPTL